MSMAIQYAMNKKRKMAHGGPCETHGQNECDMCHGGDMAKGGEVDQKKDNDRMSMRNPYMEQGIHRSSSPNSGQSIAGDKLREGKMRDAKSMHMGKIEQLKQMKKPELYADGGVIEEEEKENGFQPNPKEHPDHNYDHPVENQDDDHEDMVGRIMMMRKRQYSKGGKVSNDTPITADFEDNQFDDLVKNDDMADDYTGKNSGDEIGDEQEDEDRKDIVSKIMKSRRLKDRLPHPM